MLLLVGALAAVSPVDRQPNLGPPLTLRPGDIVAEPAAAVKSAVIELASSLPARVTKVDLVCIASPQGSIMDCVSNESRLPQGTTWADFDRMARAARVDDKAATDHSLLGLARLQARRTVLRARADMPEFYLVQLSETLDPTSKVTFVEPTRIIAGKDAHISNSADPQILSALYPVAASRNGSNAHVTAKCRVKADYSLFCREGQATGVELRLGDAEDFVMATYQLMSTARVDPSTPDGADTVGADVELSINWQLRD